MTTMNRRAYLRGAAGVTLALPFLELFERDALAAGPTRLILCYAGQAMGGDRDTSMHRFRPAQPGKLVDMPLPLSLQPLGGRELWPGTYRHPRHGDFVEPIRNWPGEVADVRKDVTIVSGLRVPIGTGPAPSQSYHHRGTVSPVLTGTPGQGASAECFGPTIDSIAEATFKSQPTIRCLVQAGNYGNGGGLDPVLSWKQNGAKVEGVRGQVSPRTMFNALFGGFTPPAGNAAPDPAQVQAVLRRKSVLDLVLPAAKDLQGKLGGEDRRRLDAHLEGLSTLRARIGELEKDNAGGAVSSCALPKDPGADPAYAGGRGGDGGGFNAGEGWSQENKRAEAFIDLLTMAMACNLTRTGAVMFSYHQSFLNGEPPTGLRGDQHQIGHGGPVERANNSANDSVALCHHYPVRYFGYLVHRLGQTASGPGRTLLDDAALGLFFEAGHGQYEGQMSAHSGDEMCALIAGRAGGLRMGEHVRLAGEHPAKVGATLLAAVGCEAKLGAIVGKEPKLFV
jgi:hypothetical protein